jgi:hypothetical protein
MSELRIAGQPSLVHSGDMGNTLAPNGLAVGSSRRLIIET